MVCSAAHITLLFKLSNKKKVNDGTINTQPIKQGNECHPCQFGSIVWRNESFSCSSGSL
ncbi:hypothetical protein VHARVF571_520006 [Vibrio harveyi]|nr:hypothetical protein VHARVF571_520006 [Vibrio harveyi]